MIAVFVRFPIIRLLIIGLLIFANSISFSQDMKLLSTKMNILVIVVDDLKSHFGSNGIHNMVTPNIDEFAKSAVVFNRAYCQIASCGPSRASFLTSKRPDRTQIFDNVPYIRDNLPNVTTLPQVFKNSGYTSLSFGKVFHGIFKNEIRDDSISWSEFPWRPEVKQYFTTEGISIVQARHRDYVDKIGSVDKAMELRRLKGLAWEKPDLPDSVFVDGMTANKAINSIQSMKGKMNPFFMMVGFTKPHLPFVAPRRYFDLYDNYTTDDILDEELPVNSVSLSHNDSKEIRGYNGLPIEGNISQNTVLELTKAYNACVSFIDFQIGKIITELKKSGLYDNTVVVLISDHGYHVGDLGLWAKNTNFETAVKVPFMISIPSKRKMGRETSQIVELLDLMPTLCEIGGLAVPEGVEGESLLPVINEVSTMSKGYAISQGPRPYSGVDKGKYMGYSLRSDEFRYTEWLPKDKGSPIVRELYDFSIHNKEKINVANDPKYKDVISDLSAVLKKNIKQ